MGRSLLRHCWLIALLVFAAGLAAAFWFLPRLCPVVVIDHLRWHPGLQDALVHRLEAEPRPGDERRQELLQLLVGAEWTLGREKGVLETLVRWSRSADEYEFELWVDAASHIAGEVRTNTPGLVARVMDLCSESCLRFDGRHYWSLLEHASALGLVSGENDFSAVGRIVHAGAVEVERGGVCGVAVLDAYINYLTMRVGVPAVPGQVVFDARIYRAMLHEIEDVAGAQWRDVLVWLHRANSDEALRVLGDHTLGGAADLVKVLAVLEILAEGSEWSEQHSELLARIEAEARAKYPNSSAVLHQVRWTRGAVEERAKEQRQKDALQSER